MIYNDWHKNRINGLNKRLAAYTLVVQDILEDLNKEACRIAGRTSYGVDSDKPFTFDDYPQTKAAVERLKQQYVSDLRTFITSNTAKEWRNSNVVQDLLINKVYSECNAKIDGVKRKHLYQTNPEALKAFQTRRINQQGTLSTTLWNQSNDYLDELEKTIGTAIKKGTSAITLSKQVSKYLADFSKLKADYKQMYGKADDIHDCEWRAARLARSEINMAYRTAEQTRWQQMDFVLGYEIRLSKSHGAEDADICDDLAGRYPKDFVWTGWHPNDKCYSVPILMDEDDFVRWNNGEPVNAKPIDDVPLQYKKWVAENETKLLTKMKKGESVPYFVADNLKSSTIKNYSADYKNYLKKAVTSNYDIVDKDKMFDKVFIDNPIYNVELDKIADTFDSILKDYGLQSINKVLYIYEPEPSMPKGGVGLSFVFSGGKIKRLFYESNGVKVVEHSFFDIADDLQGRGFSKRVTQIFYEEYKKADIDKIKLHANIDVGGYAWARYGYSYTEGKDWLIHMLTSEGEARNVPFKQAVSIVEDYYKNGNLPKDPFPMNLLTGYDWSKDLLLHSAWNGELNMHDILQTKVFESYIYGSKRQ